MSFASVLGGTLLVLSTLTTALAQVQSEQRCYPGLDCGSPTSAISGVEGGPVPGFRFTQHFVVDGVQNLLWARDLYVIGDTTVALKGAYAGNESFAVALGKFKDRASSATIAGVAGWRVATPAELNALMEKLPATTIYAYFRSRSPDPPMRSVMGALDQLDGGSRVVLDGILYANSAEGRARGHIGGADLNRFGFWLVKSLSPEVERSQARLAEPLRQYSEPIEERRLVPVDVYQLRKQEDAFEAESIVRGAATVSTTLARNVRFYARYNMKPLPRGALVSAEVVMRGLSAGGAPMPTVLVQMKPGGNQQSIVPKDLWAFAGSTDTGVWQMLGNARLELPGHIARNTFNSKEDFFLAFSANFNTCTFQTPEVIVQYVREENLLERRPPP